MTGQKEIMFQFKTDNSKYLMAISREYMYTLLIDAIIKEILYYYYIRNSPQECVFFIPMHLALQFILILSQ